MTKYIVKNCPAFQWSKCNWEGAKHECCSKNDDCPIKQVVKIYAQECPIKEIMNADDDEMFEAGRLAKQILQTLQVEEVG